MSMADDEIVTYFTVCTRVPLAEVSEIEKAYAEGENPRDLKMRLAREMVTMYHGEKKAAEAEKSFIDTFQRGNVPEEVLEIGKEYSENLVTAGVVASKSELRRLLDAGGVRNATSGEKLNEIPTSVSEPLTLKIGKRRFVRLLP